MFHHFHDDKIHKKGQGSISKDDFYKLIKFIGRKNILDANIFFEKLKSDWEIKFLIWVKYKDIPRAVGVGKLDMFFSLFIFIQ